MPMKLPTPCLDSGTCDAMAGASVNSGSFYLACLAAVLLFTSKFIPMVHEYLSYGVFELRIELLGRERSAHMIMRASRKIADAWPRRLPNQAC